MVIKPFFQKSNFLLIISYLRQLRERENEGIAIGEKRGIAMGQEQVTALFKRLQEQNCTEDMTRAINDKQYLQ